jgi:hypothetical protein
MFKNLLASLLFLSISSICFAEPWSSLFNREQIGWNEWDLPSSDSMKSQVVDFIKNQHPGYLVFQEFIHTVDFSRDGLPDIIYSGYVGQESNVTIFLIYNAGTFEEVFAGCGDLVALEHLSNWSPLRFRIFNYACCGDFRHFIEDYVPHRKNGKLSYVLSNRILVDSRIKPPKKFFETSKFFKIENEQYNLRTGPIIDDKVFDTEWGEAKGNVIAVYVNGSIGQAISSKMDETGRMWWFVIMNSSNNKIWELYHHHDGCNSKEKADLAGWMSSRFLNVQ